MDKQPPGEMDEANRDDSGLQKLGLITESAKLPHAQLFLDAIDLSSADRASLVRAIDEFYRPTAAESERAILTFAASHSHAEVQALSDLGNRIVESHSQFLAISAWLNVFRHWREAPPQLVLKGLDVAIADYLRFSEDMGRAALGADSAAGLDGLDGTHTVLATIARWHQLRHLLRTIEGHLGDRRDVFLAWARSLEPEHADLITPLADLERSI